MDNEEVITELFRRTRLHIDPHDPAFLIVELNKIMLEKEGDEVAGRISKVADGFERIAQRSADELVDTINKASSVLQAQIVAFEASAQKISVPEFLANTYPSAKEEKAEVVGDGFRERFVHWAVVSSIFATGLIVGLLIAGFMWVFFR